MTRLQSRFLLQEALYCAVDIMTLIENTKRLARDTTAQSKAGSFFDVETVLSKLDTSEKVALLSGLFSTLIFPCFA